MKFLRIATRNSGKWLFVVNSTKQHLKLNSHSFSAQALFVSEIPLINILTLYTIKRSPGFVHPFLPFPHWNTYLFLMCRRLKKFAPLTLKMFLKNAFFFLIKVSKLTLVQMHLIWLLSFCWAKDWNYAYYVSAGPLSPIPTPKLTSTAWTWWPHRVWKKQAWGKGCFIILRNHNKPSSQPLSAWYVQPWSCLFNSLPWNASMAGRKPLLDESHWPQGEPVHWA